MKKKSYLIPILLIIFLINQAYAFPQGNETNNATANLTNITESDQDIILLQHLIEVDAVQLQSTNKLYIRETLIFKNIGAKNFSGPLRTWVQDGIEGISVSKAEMMTGVMAAPLQAVQNGNIISWQDFLPSNNPLPPLYSVEYLLPAEPKGTLKKTKQYSKKLFEPTLITKQPGALTLKITKSEEESVSITDEKGNSISASGNPTEDGRYEWVTPQFREINIEISQAAITPAGIAGYVVIGLLIVLAVSYPFIRKKSERLQAIEERIRSSLKREPQETGEEAEEETAKEPVEELEPGEEAVSEEDEELSGKTKEELESEKDDILAKLDELEKEYSSGNMLDEEYEELKGTYSARVEKINKKLEQSG